MKRRNMAPAGARTQVAGHLSLRCGQLSNCQRLQSFFRADPDVVHDAIRVTVWGRWFLLLVVLFLSLYRPGHGFPDAGESLPLPLLLHLALHLLMNLVPLFFNGLTHYRLLTNRPLTWRWMLGLATRPRSTLDGSVAGMMGGTSSAWSR